MGVTERLYAECQRLNAEADWLAKQILNCPYQRMPWKNGKPSWCSARDDREGFFECSGKIIAECWREAAREAVREAVRKGDK